MTEVVAFTCILVVLLIITFGLSYDIKKAKEEILAKLEELTKETKL